MTAAPDPAAEVERLRAELHDVRNRLHRVTLNRDEWCRLAIKVGFRLASTPDAEEKHQDLLDALVDMYGAAT